MIINKVELLSYRTWVENMNDEARDPFEKDGDEGELAENGSSFQSSELGFINDLQVLFGSAVQPFGSGVERSEGLAARGSTNHFSGQGVG